MLPVACAYTRAGSQGASANIETTRAWRARLVNIRSPPRWRCLYPKDARLSMERTGQFQDSESDDFGGVHQVRDVHVFVRLMRDIQNARAVRDAVGDAGDAREVFLVVSAGAGDEAAAAAEDAVQGAVERAHDRGPLRRRRRMDHHQVANLVLEIRHVPRDLVQQRDD